MAGGRSSDAPVRVEGPTTNEVVLRGRVCSDPVARDLPSGDRILTFRVSVPRARPAGSRAGTDWVDCVVWTGALRRSVGAWASGDRVEVTGSLRRRFFRAGVQTATRLEVEVLRARRLARGPVSGRAGRA